MPRSKESASKSARQSSTTMAIASHPPIRGARRGAQVAEQEIITASIIVRRRRDGSPLRDIRYFVETPPPMRERLTRSEFEKKHGSDAAGLERVAIFARENHLIVTAVSQARRTVEVRGTVGQFQKTFGVKFYQFHTRIDSYRGYIGAVRIPKTLASIVETIVGLDNRPLPIRHSAADPAVTVALTPQQVANLYHFPAATGSGETIGIFEAVTSDGPPGYAASDLVATMNGFGGGLVAPTPTDVSVGGQTNSGVSDPETVLDITVASAIAQSAAIAVYFAGSSINDVLQCIQKMVHPEPGGPSPTVISISYIWSPDDQTDYITDDEYTQFSALFQDAANLNITVLTTTGDTGAMYLSDKTAQAPYPGSDPWVLACGGTTVGNLTKNGFDEFVWNDTSPGGSGATGGGVSAKFPIPGYQNGIAVPLSKVTGKSGRGIPDVAGNASPNSGYQLVLNGTVVGPVGGTSAVAPLYAGLIATVNSLLLGGGALYRVGFANPTLYASGATVCRDVTAAAGPVNNDFGKVSGYPAGPGWDACTGLGSIQGAHLLNAFRPLAVAVRRRVFDGCDPGPVSSLTATFDATVTGGFAPLNYQWNVTGADAIGPLGPKPWQVNLKAPFITIKVPDANSIFHLSVTATDPFGNTVTAQGSYKALDSVMADFLESLCKLIHTALEFRPPVYIDPGDPFAPSELQKINGYAERVAGLSAKLLNAHGVVERRRVKAKSRSLRL